LLFSRKRDTIWQEPPVNQETEVVIRKDLAERNMRRSVIFLSIFVIVEGLRLGIWFLVERAAPSGSPGILFILVSFCINILFLILFSASGTRLPRLSTGILVAWVSVSRMYQVVSTGFDIVALLSFLILFEVLAMILASPRMIISMAALSLSAFGLSLALQPLSSPHGLELFLFSAMFVSTASMWNRHSTLEHIAKESSRRELEASNRTLREAKEGLSKIAAELEERNGALGRATTRLDRTVSLQALVLRLNYLLVEHLSLEKYLATLLADVVSTLGHRGPACILLCDPEGRRLRVVAPIKYDPVKAEGYFLKMEDTFQYRETGGSCAKTMIIRHLSRYLSPDAAPILDRTDGSIVDCTLSSPVIIDGKLYGLINLDSSDNEAFDDEDIEIMDYIRTQVATVLRHFDLLERIDRLSRYDQLTGFNNRWVLEDLAGLVESFRPLSLVMIDIDGLKRINDSFGHLAGDRTIIRFSQALRARSRGEDRIVRMGGDEFLVIRPGKFAREAEAEMDELLGSLSAGSEGAENPTDPGAACLMSVSFSYGISESGIDGTGFDELVAVADRRLYEAKAVRRDGR
jgi:diguanylate cyclase (GGDEF)-like protein